MLKRYLSFRSFLLLVFSFFSIVSLAYAATTIGNDIFTTGTITSQGKAYLTGGVSAPVLNATSSLIDNLTVDQNASLATTTISNIFTTQAPVNFTNGMVSVKAPFKIKQIGSYIWPVYSASVSIFSRGNFVYATNEVAGTCDIFDVSNPAAPQLLSTISAAFPWGVYVSGNYLYIADGSNLVIYNIADPRNPQYTGRIFLPPSLVGTVYKVVVKGKYAYVINNSEGLYIVDISNPAAPVLAGYYSTADAVNLTVQGNYVYLAKGTFGLQLINVSDPQNPVLVGSLAIDAYDIAADGRYLYIIGGSIFNVVNVSNPATPVLIKTISYSVTDAPSSIKVSGNYIYAGSSVIDIHDPANAFIAGTNSGVAGSDIAINGNYLYGVSWSGIYIYSLSGLSAPTANLGNIQSNNLTVTENTNLSQLNISENLTVGKSALFNSDLVAQKDVNILHNLTVGDNISAPNFSLNYATTSAYIALPEVKFIPIATPTSPKIGQCFMDNGAKPQVSCYDGAAWHTLW